VVASHSSSNAQYFIEFFLFFGVSKQLIYLFTFLQFGVKYVLDNFLPKLKADSNPLDKKYLFLVICRELHWSWTLTENPRFLLSSQQQPTASFSVLHFDSLGSSLPPDYPLFEEFLLRLHEAVEGKESIAGSSSQRSIVGAGHSLMGTQHRQAVTVPIQGPESNDCALACMCNIESVIEIMKGGDLSILHMTGLQYPVDRMGEKRKIMQDLISKAGKDRALQAPADDQNKVSGGVTEAELQSEDDIESWSEAELIGAVHVTCDVMTGSRLESSVLIDSRKLSVNLQGNSSMWIGLPCPKGHRVYWEVERSGRRLCLGACTELVNHPEAPKTWLVQGGAEGLPEWDEGCIIGVLMDRTGEGPGTMTLAVNGAWDSPLKVVTLRGSEGAELVMPFVSNKGNVCVPVKVNPGFSGKFEHLPGHLDVEALSKFPLFKV